MADTAHTGGITDAETDEDIADVAGWPDGTANDWQSKSSLAARRNPLPGANKDNASSRLVLPEPFGPNKITGPIDEVPSVLSGPVRDKRKDG